MSSSDNYTMSIGNESVSFDGKDIGMQQIYFSRMIRDLGLLFMFFSSECMVQIWKYKFIILHFELCSKIQHLKCINRNLKMYQKCWLEFT